MTRRVLRSAAAALALAALSPRADAYFGYTTSFEADADAYAVTDANPFDDPPAGSPPASWLDIRDNAWDGLIEEAASGTRGVTSATGAAHAEVYVDPGVGFGPLTTNGGGQQTNPGRSYAFGVDLYLDPAWQPQGSTHGDGSPDLEWANYVDHAFSGGGNYTRGGLTLEVLDTDGNGTRNYVITSIDPGHDAFDTETPGWYRLEVVFSVAPDGSDSLSFPDVLVEHNIYTLAGQRLWTETHQDYGQVNGAFLGGDALSAFTYVAPNLPFVAIDNQRVGVPLHELPEPTSAAVVVIGAGMMLQRRRAKFE